MSVSKSSIPPEIGAGNQGLSDEVRAPEVGSPAVRDFSETLAHKPRMKEGRFIAVVGPSGAGKDSVMEALCIIRPDLHHVRRVITRDADAGGEDFDAVSENLFATRAASGDFALHWKAHGLSYGIPATVHPVLAGGKDALANLSRGVLDAAANQFNQMIVLHVIASSDVLERRLSQRGREKAGEIDRRLSRPVPAFPTSLTIATIDNSGTLEASVSAALMALYPANV